MLKFNHRILAYTSIGTVKIRLLYRLHAIYSNNAKIVYEYNILMTFIENCYPSYEHVICQDSEKLTILSTNKGNNKRL